VQKATTGHWETMIVMSVAAVLSSSTAVPFFPSATSQISLSSTHIATVFWLEVPRLTARMKRVHILFQRFWSLEKHAAMPPDLSADGVFFAEISKAVYPVNWFLGYADVSYSTMRTVSNYLWTVLPGPIWS
jgi:hypothetical protein